MADGALADALLRLRVRVHVRLAERLGLAVDEAWLQERARYLDNRALWAVIEQQGAAAPPAGWASIMHWIRRFTQGQ